MKTAYSSTLPKELVEELEIFAAKLEIPKNKRIYSLFEGNHAFNVPA